jgi:hypothetical protein
MGILPGKMGGFRRGNGEFTGWFHHGISHEKKANVRSRMIGLCSHGFLMSVFQISNEPIGNKKSRSLSAPGKSMQEQTIQGKNMEKHMCHGQNLGCFAIEGINVWSSIH